MYRDESLHYLNTYYLVYTHREMTKTEHLFYFIWLRYTEITVFKIKVHQICLLVRHSRDSLQGMLPQPMLLVR